MTLIDDREICVKCGKKFMPRLLKPLTICEDCHDKLETELTERKSEVKVDRMVMPTEPKAVCENCKFKTFPAGEKFTGAIICENRMSIYYTHRRYLGSTCQQFEQK